LSAVAWFDLRRDEMERREAMTVVVPAFANESEEAAWWASEDGRTFLRLQSAETRAKVPGGSRLVGALAE
jgi:hypothetical protein